MATKENTKEVFKKTIRLNPIQEEQLTKCMKLLKTNSAQKTFEEMLELIPKLMDEKDRLALRLKDEIQESQNAKRILRNLYDSQRSLAAFIEKS